jgi:hypothetical protein
MSRRMKRAAICSDFHRVGQSGRNLPVWNLDDILSFAAFGLERQGLD